MYLKKNPSGNEQEDWIETETLGDSEHSLKAMINISCGEFVCEM